ncbi:MAG: long-chain fatty acid--CoA ligase [Alphaproteobacteria bacterium]|nr:long-chain fatty acid--CoA ligase [Alphaproteobacteria bacterium]
MQLIQGLNRAVTINGGGTATIFRDRRWTWREVAERIGRLAGGLAKLGVGAGDRVAILAMNSDRYWEAMYAIPGLGAIMVPLNTRLAPPEIAFMLADSGTKVWLVDDTFAETPGKLAGQIPDVAHVVHIGEGPTPPGMIGWESLLAERPAGFGEAGDNDVAGIFYTGGTTGRSKGVMLTHRNLVGNAAQIIPAAGYRYDTVYIHAGPMFHLADAASTFAVTVVGGTHVFIPRFDAGDMLAEMAKHRVTNALLVPTMINATASHPEIGSFDLSALRVIPYGASPMPDAVLQRAKRAMPHVRWLHVYGMTEAAPIVTSMDRHQAEPEGQRAQSCGRPCLLMDVRIADADDTEVPRGTVGEVQVRGPNIMRGYWNLPDVTASALRGGWYHSGDGGWMDEDGYVYIVDRFKDMIISGGENIYSAEVESAISTLDGVAEVAVIGIPDEKWGEAVHAVVVPRAGRELSAEAVVAHCRALIAGYKVPRSVEIRAESLPLSGAGKVLKTVLREVFWAGRMKQVS